MENAVLSSLFLTLAGVLKKPDSKDKSAALIMLGAALAELGVSPGFILAITEAASRVDLRPEDSAMASNYSQMMFELMQEAVDEARDKIAELVNLYNQSSKVEA